MLSQCNFWHGASGGLQLQRVPLLSGHVAACAPGSHQAALQGRAAVGLGAWRMAVVVKTVLGSHFGVGAPLILVFLVGGCSLGVREFDPWPHGGGLNGALVNGTKD